jgi:outer membrane protein assembly factor BamB
MRMLLSCILLFILLPVFGQEISQWRGPARDGIFPENGLLKKWPEPGPKLVLQISGIGKGYSQPVVYKGVIYITGIKQDTLDMITAYDLEGKLLWSQVYGRAWANSYTDTRSTPVIQNDRVYLIGGMGIVCCLDTKDGKILWSQDAHNQFSTPYGSGSCVCNRRIRDFGSRL